MILSYGKEVIAVCQGLRLEKRDAFDEAYRRFKKQTDRNLVVTECRARRFFESKTEKRKKQKISAKKEGLKASLHVKAL